MNVAEAAFYAHLTNTASLDYIVREGFSLEIARDVIPAEVGRRLTEWAIDYYFTSGRTVAPSKDAIMQAWGDQLEPLDITIDDDVETDSIQWAIDQLRNDYADYQSGLFATAFVKAVRTADGPDRVDAVQDYSQILHMLSQSLVTRKNEMDGYDGLSDALKRYQERELESHQFKGLTLGIPEIDKWCMGIHPGEMAVFAATSGGGKSWLSIMALLNEFSRNRKGVLFTLENDIEMTYDRIACVQCRVDYEKWQRGEVEPGDVKRVKDFLQIMEASDKRPLIIQPEMSQSTGQAMVRRAIIEEADSIIIDQLSHIQPVAGTKVRERNQIVAEIIRDIEQQIKIPGFKLPLMLLHQINRKGREEARKINRYLMEHLGEATQVENAASLVMAIFQSPDHTISETAELQCLKARRVKAKDFEVSWRPAVGDVRFRKEIVHE